MNKGFFHPKLNPEGTSKDINGKFFYETNIAFNTLQDCFDPLKYNAPGNHGSGRFDGETLSSISTKKIVRTLSGNKTLVKELVQKAINTPLGLFKGGYQKKSYAYDGNGDLDLSSEKPSTVLVGDAGYSMYTYGVDAPNAVRLRPDNRGLVTMPEYTGTAYAAKETQYRGITPIIASDPSASDYFGTSVAISGNRVLVGANYKDAGGIDSSGQVYVYEWNSGTSRYDEIQKLSASDPALSDYFGTSVAISGNRVLVGAFGKDAGGLGNSGQVYVYEWNSGTSKYVEIQKLTASDPSASDDFGTSVAISGNRVLVGANRKDAGGLGNSGQVYVYEWNSGTSKYDEIQKLRASDAATGDYFGTSVAISGNRVLVGASYKDAGGIVDSGQVYVYEWNSGTGKYDEIQKLRASDAATGDLFGASVAISGNRVLVGAFRKDAGGIVDSGQVYVYEWNSGTGKYDEIQKLSASDAAGYDNFGFSVAISGNRVLVGAFYKDAGGIYNSGQVYVYDQETTPFWVYEPITPPSRSTTRFAKSEKVIMFLNRDETKVLLDSDVNLIDTSRIKQIGAEVGCGIQRLNDLIGEYESSTIKNMYKTVKGVTL